MNSMAIGSNTFVMLMAGKTSDYSLESIFYTIRRVGDLSDVSSRGYKAILYLNDNVCLKGGYGLTVDGNTSSPTIEENTIRIGENSAIALSKTATEQSLQNGRNLAAISFSGRGGSYQDDGTIKFSSTSRIILDSIVIKSGSIFRIFSDYSTYINESDSTKNYIIVQSINGNFKTTVNRMGNLLGKGWTDYSYGDGSDLDIPGSNNPGTTPPSNTDSGNSGITTPSNPDSGNPGSTPPQAIQILVTQIQVQATTAMPITQELTLQAHLITAMPVTQVPPLQAHLITATSQVIQAIPPSQAYQVYQVQVLSMRPSQEVITLT